MRAALLLSVAALRLTGIRAALALRHLRTVLAPVIRAICSSRLTAERRPVGIAELRLVVLGAEIGSREIRIVTGVVKIIRAVVVVHVVAIYVVRVDVVPVYIVDVPVVVVVAIHESIGVGNIGVVVVDHR